jgi:hypothetical protein
MSNSVRALVAFSKEKSAHITMPYSSPVKWGSNKNIMHIGGRSKKLNLIIYRSERGRRRGGLGGRAPQPPSVKGHHPINKSSNDTSISISNSSREE